MLSRKENTCTALARCAGASLLKRNNMQTSQQDKISPALHSSQPAPRQSCQACLMQPPETENKTKISSRIPYFKISPPNFSTTALVLLMLNKTNNNVTHNNLLSLHHSLPSCSCNVKTVSDVALTLCFIIWGFFSSAGDQ